MKRYKIMVYTIQGYKRYFCYWKMGQRYYTRLVSDRNDFIVYTDNDILTTENYLLNNLEYLQIKNYTIEYI